MTDWGLPDWRDPSTYGETSKWSDLRWRWEFLRRREDLRSDFQEFAPRAADLRNARLAAEGQPIVEDQINSPNFTTAPIVGEAYGYIGIPNPRFSNLPEEFLRYLTIKQPHSGFRPYYDADGNPIYREGVAFSPDQAVWVFDLDDDLGPQLAVAKKILHQIQSDRKGPRKLTKHRRGNWLIYLRVLDAREDGASLSQISMILPKTYGNTSEQTAHNVLHQAKELGFRI